MACCRSLRYAIIIVVALFTTSHVVFGMFGPIGTDPPVLAGGNVANNRPPNSIFQDHEPPYPTNNWFVAYATGAGNTTAGGPFPFQSSLAENEIRFGISTNRSFDGVSLYQPNQTDWALGFDEHDGDPKHHKILYWDTQSVTLQYFTGQSTMTSYMVPGSPYLTFLFESATPKFTSFQGRITSFNGALLTNDTVVIQSGTKFSVGNGAGTYLLYSLDGPITLTATGIGNITADSPFSGVLRVAKLNTFEHQALLDSHVSTYPTAVETDYSFYGDTGILRFSWTVQGSPSELLMLTWPHHRMKLQAPNYAPQNSLSYLTTKGFMYPILGNVWEMKYDLPTITWNAPRDPDPSCLGDIMAGLEYEIAHLPPVAPPTDFYFTGQRLATASRLALIAEHVNRHDLIPPVIEYLKDMFEFYYNASATVIPAYETGWGGIIRGDARNNVTIEFGNAFYNDHHFHYGYLLAVGAVIAKNDADWLKSHGNLMTWLLRDIVNPSREDRYFDVTRCRDFFAGHSWASGMANGATGETGARNQESTGEAVNGYYGAMLWAIVIGNQDIQNYARLLLATEQHAAQVYWHLYPNADAQDRDQPYPEQAIRNLTTIGNVDDWLAGAWLFWGIQRVEIASIQTLPPTPVNEYLYDEEWAREVFNYTQVELKNTTYLDAWKSLVYLVYSQVDPQEAMEHSNNLTSWGASSSYSNHMYFLATRPKAAGICGNMPANPIGTFYIRSETTGKYVAKDELPNLIANAGSKSDAARFEFGYAPNAGTIQEESTGKFIAANVTTPPMAVLNVTSIKANTSAEIFLIRQKVGADHGVYSILAAANQNFVVIEANSSSLIVNATSEADSDGFELVYW